MKIFILYEPRDFLWYFQELGIYFREYFVVFKFLFKIMKLTLTLQYNKW